MRRLTQALPRDTDMTAAELQQHLRTAGITLNRQQVQPVRDALAVAAYHAQTQVFGVRHGRSSYHRCFDGMATPSRPKRKPQSAERRTTTANWDY